MTYYTGKDLARSFRVVRKNTLQLANEIPEASYSYRVTPESRTVAETLAHVAAGSRWHQLANGVERTTAMSFEDFGRYAKGTQEYEASLKTRGEIIAALETNGEEFASWLESLDDAMLAEVVSFPSPVDPPQKTRFELLMGVKEHEMHHRGQLMVVQRLLGIVPHLTRARQARMAAARA